MTTEFIVKDLLPLAKPISMFTPDPANARKNSQANMESFRESLKKFGSETDRFFHRVKISENGCWNFLDLKPHGYGQFHTPGKTWRAHRWIMIRLGFLKNDPKTLVLHDCDNRACVNPNHLSIGDYKKNMADAKLRGRTRLIAEARLGSKNPMAKLNDKKVRKIKELIRNGIKQTEISKKFGICRAVVSEINTGKLWQHIT